MLDSSLFLDAHFHLAAANIMEATKGGSDIAARLSTGFWEQIFSMGLFGRITIAAQTIAGIGVIYKGYYYLQDVGKNTLDIDKVVGSLIALLLTILMTQNNGLAMNAVRGMRNFGNSINTTVMTGITADLASLQSTRALNTVNSSQPFFQTFKDDLKTCAPKAQANCYQTAVAKLQTGVATLNPPDPEVNRAVNEIAETYNNIASSRIASGAAPAGTTINPVGSTAAPDQSFLEWAGSVATKAADSVINAPANIAEGLIIMLLTALTMCFYLALELTLILLGLTLPIHIALSLFDPAPLKTWFGNYWLLINAKLCFCIIVGIISYLQLWVQTNSNNAFLSMLLIIIGLLMAFYAPVLTFFYVQGSALALAGAMNAIPGNAIGGAAKGVGRAAGKGIGSAAGAFMGGAMKGAGVGKMGQNFGKKVAQKLGRK
jgi:hypothetical protein